MNNFALSLKTASVEDELYLELNTDERISTFNMETADSLRVYNDKRYSLKLICDYCSEVKGLSLYINDVKVSVLYNASTGEITPYVQGEDSTLFYNCFGYARIRLSFFIEDAPYVLYSDYMSVYVESGTQNESVMRMAEYIYNNNDILLFNDSSPVKSTGGFSNSKKTDKSITAKILLLQQLESIIKSSLPYFYVNSRFTVQEEEDIDSLEKLRVITPKTLQYICQHPNELSRINSTQGIRINNCSYIPRHTLVTKKIVTYDIYENRMILQFINTLIITAECILSDIDKKNEIYSSDDNPNGYVKSSYYLVSNILEILNKQVDNIKAIKDNLINNLEQYNNIFNIKYDDKPMKALPIPTHIFTSVPQYKKMYDNMCMWFMSNEINYNKESQLFSFLNASDLYEAYVLAKLNKYVSQDGLTLTNAQRIKYSGIDESNHSIFNNYFAYDNDDQTVELYYEPLIGSGILLNEQLGLYRTVSTSIETENMNVSEGRYYTPDYVVKIKDKATGKAKFVILDAKFSKLDSVKRHQLMPLVYRYVFSIAPINTQDSIEGMVIVNGKAMFGDGLYNVHDLAMSNIKPSMHLMTMTEVVPNNVACHNAMLDDLIGKYII